MTMDKRCIFQATTTAGAFEFWMLMRNCSFDGRVSEIKVRKRALERIREKMLDEELPTNVKLLEVKSIRSVKSNSTRRPLSYAEKFQKQIRKYGDNPPYWR